MAHSSAVFALLVLLMAGCIGDDSEPDPTVPPTVTGIAPDIPTATTALQPPATATRTPAQSAMLNPGPTMPPPERLFFRSRDDIWQFTSGGQPARVTQGIRTGPFAAAPDGSRVAAVVYEAPEAEGSEQIRIFGADGADLQLLYGPTELTGSYADPRITALVWSWDAATVAVTFEGGLLAVLPVPAPEAQTVATLTPVYRVHAGEQIVDPTWAPSSAGIAWLREGPDGRQLVVSPVGIPDATYALTGDGNGADVSDSPVLGFEWLPGRGRIAWVPDRTEDPASYATAGSIYTMPPDGASQELLVSAGRFAPVASIDLLEASPEGQRLAFTIMSPDARGLPTFRSLWLHNIDADEFVEIPVPRGYRVTDIWWISAGLTWRMEQGDNSDDATAFAIGLFDPNTGQSSIVFQATGE